ncbi:MAG TPA: DUF5655 domain-containing protein [Bacillota bacterium]|nr:DUF5655 domain-containing protein [Bacillota bacterium]HOG52432.1 DUF5655 domain-containing protein [Bacillota bacterium]
MYDPSHIFNRAEGSLELYLAADGLPMSFGGARRRVSKTQVSYSTRRAFAWIWPPVRKVRGRPEKYVALSFAIGRNIQSAGVEQALEANPRRWMRHIILSETHQLDEELLSWQSEAHSFAYR